MIQNPTTVGIGDSEGLLVGDALRIADTVYNLQGKENGYLVFKSQDERVVTFTPDETMTLIDQRMLTRLVPACIVRRDPNAPKPR